MRCRFTSADGAPLAPGPSARPKNCLLEFEDIRNAIQAVTYLTGPEAAGRLKVKGTSCFVTYAR